MKKLWFALSLFGVLLMSACNKKADLEYYYYTPEDYATLSQYLNLPKIPHDYAVNLPPHLQSSGLFARPVLRDKAILGRVLFYDKNLSSDGKVSCASCHKQEIGFSDDKALSDGVEGRSAARNSIALASVANFSAYYGTDINGPSAIRFLWDNRAETAADQSLAALTNPNEMNLHTQEIIAAVEAQPYYEPLFKVAYGDGNVTVDRVTEAISNFINSLGSFNSKFDQAANNMSGNFFVDYNANFSGLTAAENRGKALYQTNCSGCHSTNMGRPVLNNASNGLYADDANGDLGVGAIFTGSQNDGTFKVPTLRNIALSAPYMHDGSIATLEQVVDFYSTGVKNHKNLHFLLKNGSSPKKMNFTTEQKADLIAFLNTLTDEQLKSDEKFSNPFK